MYTGEMAWIRIELDLFVIHRIILLCLKKYNIAYNTILLWYDVLQNIFTSPYRLWCDLSRSAHDCHDPAWCVRARSRPHVQARARQCQTCRSFCLWISPADRCHVCPRKNSIWKTRGKNEYVHKSSIYNVNHTNRNYLNTYSYLECSYTYKTPAKRPPGFLHDITIIYVW